jgi:hypothetical protein
MTGIFAKEDVDLVGCGQGFSFYFDLVEKEWAKEGRDAVHRICTLMRKMGVQSLLREELHIAGELQEEVDDVAKRSGGGIGATAVRFTFFRSLPASRKWYDVPAHDLLAYAVFVTLENAKGKVTYVYEAVIRPPGFSQASEWQSVTNYYVHCVREFELTLGTVGVSRPPLKLPGTFFCQQNGLTHVCAHAALRIALNSWPAYTGAKVTPRMINQVLGYDHSGSHSVPAGGLTSSEITKVVEARGFGAISAEFLLRPDIDYEAFVYPLIESGCPVILGVTGPGVAHVVAILGHTLNTDRWSEARHKYGVFPSSQYIPTSSWVDHFIASDDNFGAYVTLPTEGLRNILVPKHNPNLHAAVAVGLVPKGADYWGYIAEQVAARVANTLIEKTVLEPPNRWLTQLQAGLKVGTKIVCRTLLCDRERFCSHMAEVKDEQDNRLSPEEVERLRKALDERFWVTEITTTNLYTGNKHKLGDVVLKCKVDSAPRRAVPLLAWLPGVVWEELETNGMPVPWSLQGHIPLLRGVGEEMCHFDW